MFYKDHSGCCVENALKEFKKRIWENNDEVIALVQARNVDGLD